MTRTPIHHRRRGFTLIEMIAALILLGAFFMLAGRLFHATFKLSQSVTQAQDAVASFDSAVAVLRSDIHSARELKLADQKTLTLDGQRPIVWTIDGATATRSEGDRVRHWSVPPNATLKIDRPTVVLTIPQSKATPGGEIRMTNQVQLVTGLTK